MTSCKTCDDFLAPLFCACLASRFSWLLPMAITGGRLGGCYCHFGDFLLFISAAHQVHLFQASQCRPVLCSMMHISGLLGHGSEAIVREKSALGAVQLQCIHGSKTREHIVFAAFPNRE